MREFNLNSLLPFKVSFRKSVPVFSEAITKGLILACPVLHCIHLEGNVPSPAKWPKIWCNNFGLDSCKLREVPGCMNRTRSGILQSQSEDRAGAVSIPYVECQQGWLRVSLGYLWIFQFPLPKPFLYQRSRGWHLPCTHGMSEDLILHWQQLPSFPVHAWTNPAGVPAVLSQAQARMLYPVVFQREIPSPAFTDTV